jgi:mono/diheme cytochrome c family protein
MRRRPALLPTVWTLLALAALIQLIPYRVTNPPTTGTPTWDSPRTEELARRACFDCHSNEVVTPWYGHVAPVAWVLRHHVDEGRAVLNFSAMDRPQEEAHDAGEEVREGEMPPAYYRLAHPTARLGPEERAALAAGLDATLGGEGEGEGEHEGDD